jgi:hypothetical protein
MIGKKNWVLGFCLALIMGSSSGQAAELQRVITATSDAYPDTQYQIWVQTDVQGDLIGLAYAENSENPRIFNLDQLHHGAVLSHDKGHNLDVLTLVLPADFDPQHGGSARINFLSNGITHSYRYFVMELVRNGSAGWATHTERARGFAPFDKLFLKANRFLGQVVGLSRIETR